MCAPENEDFIICLFSAVYNLKFLESVVMGSWYYFACFCVKAADFNLSLEELLIEVVASRR